MNRVSFEKIKCIVYDFDGVMTDNRVLVSEDGKEAVYCNRSDGLAVAAFKKLGIYQVIVSTEENPVVNARASKLKIDVIHGIKDKGEAILSICKDKGLNKEEIFFIGNDLNDLPAFDVAGITGCPSDAEKEILEKSDWISNRRGGYGVIRSLYEDFIK